MQKAQADALKLLNESAPNEQVVKLKSLEAFRAAADGKATKIIIPSEIQGLAGLASSLKTVFETPDPVSLPNEPEKESGKKGGRKDGK